MIDKKTTDILKYIKKHPECTLTELCDKYDRFAVEASQKLLEEGYVREHISRRMRFPESDLYRYTITIEGTAYLENRFHNGLIDALDAIKP